VLELGGNAAAIVEPDADLTLAARRIAVGAFAYSGQVCISVQRVLIHESILDRFAAMLLDAISDHVRVGATADPAVLVGPLISSAEAERVMSWIAEALAAGARSLTGPLRRAGSIVHPVLLAEVPTDARVWREEAFGPVAAVAPYRTFEEAVELCNDSDFGLQAGVFTLDIGKAMYAFDHLAVGGIVLGDAPTRRVDHMPYGGVKGSGEGREGPRFALEHMTEERLLLIAG
jgi:acyl-CoA reductase-like NAD-dependent aldehyde dehydrogenase